MGKIETNSEDIPTKERADVLLRRMLGTPPPKKLAKPEPKDKKKPADGTHKER